jgi:broad specificity phosphatase PhoE
MAFYEKKYLKYKKKYFDLKGSAPPVVLDDGEEIKIKCKKSLHEHTQEAALLAPPLHAHVLHAPKVEPVQPPGIFSIQIAMLTGNKYSFVVNPDDTIYSVKLKLFHDQGIPIHQQKYKFKSIELEDKKTLSSYKISNNDTINLLINLGASKVPSHISRIYVMRHGDRADDEQVEGITKEDAEDFISKRKNDTPLAPKGKSTATLRARELLDSGAQFYKMFSSPLLRCIQTASFVNEVLGLPKIYLDVKLREVWHPKVLKTPINEFNLYTMEELRDPKFEINVDQLEIIPGEILPIEEQRGLRGEADTRYKKVLLDTASAYLGKEVLIVSHGDSLGSLADLCNKEACEVNYCSVICADFNNETKEWTLISTFSVGLSDKIPGEW